MKTRYLIYVVCLGVCCIGSLLLMVTFLTLLTDLIGINVSSGIIGALGVGCAIETTRRMRPTLRRISGIKGVIGKKIDKFHAAYPIVSNELPTKALEDGDYLLIDGFGKCVYVDKFRGKYLIEPREVKSDVVELTETELKDKCSKIWCHMGVKWERDRC